MIEFPEPPSGWRLWDLLTGGLKDLVLAWKRAAHPIRHARFGQSLQRTPYLARGLLDHLVGLREDSRRDGKTERLRRLQIDGELEARRGFDRQLARRDATKNAGDKMRDPAAELAPAGSIGKETSRARILGPFAHAGDAHLPRPPG